MAVAHDADSNANSGAAAVASLTWSHTTTGSNTLLVVALGWSGNTTTMGITHAGNNPTGNTISLLTPTLNYHLQIWWWIAPTTGAQNIIATPSANAAIFGGGATFTGVDQTTPTTEQGTSNGTSFGGIAVSAWATRTEMFFAALSLANQVTTATADPNATQAFNQFDATQARTTAAEYMAVTNGMRDLQWTLSGSTARPWVQQVIGINPVGGVGVPHVELNNSGLRPAPFKPGIAR